MSSACKRKPTIVTDHAAQEVRQFRRLAQLHRIRQQELLFANSGLRASFADVAPTVAREERITVISSFVGSGGQASMTVNTSGVLSNLIMDERELNDGHCATSAAPARDL